MDKLRQGKISIFPDIEEQLKLMHIQVDRFMVQILSEHGSFKDYLFRFGIVEDNLYNDCNAIDTTYHAALQCENHENICVYI